MKSKVMILCSGFGLGFYIPGLLLKNALLNEEIKAEVDVFENYLHKEKEYKVEKSRKEYHKNFSAAQLAARLPIDIRESLNEEKVALLLKKWQQDERKYFISLSGHWGHILKQYMERYKKNIRVENLHIDSDDAPSWLGLNRYFPEHRELFHDLQMYDKSQEKILYRLPIETGENVLPYRKRENRFVVHGGGWGMGTYQAAQKELSLQNFKLDIVVYQPEDVLEKSPNIRYFTNNPEWRAWCRYGGTYTFPPYRQTEGEEPGLFIQTKKWHWLYDYIKNSKGIISKPGAGTLIDSLESCTPLIMLEPFGKHEKANFQLWEDLGLGIRYDSWKDSGFDLNLLDNSYEKLKAMRRNTKSLCDYIKAELREG